MEEKERDLQAAVQKLASDNSRLVRVTLYVGTMSI